MRPITTLHSMGLPPSDRAQAAHAAGMAARAERPAPRAERQPKPDAGSTLLQATATRLGLPADSDASDVFAALDRVKAQNAAQASVKAQQDAEDDLFARAFGGEPTTSDARLSADDQALYNAAFGEKG